MNHVLELIRNNGDLFYLITFLWTALEGETFVIFAALAAQRGYLSIELLFLSAWLGSFCGDQVYFFIGRKFGTRIIQRFPKIKPKLERVFLWLERHATSFILSYRFMYGIRNISGIAVGMSKLPWRRFSTLNAIAAFVWALAFCGFGYLFGGALKQFGRRKDEVVDSGVHSVTYAVLGLFLVIIAIRFVLVTRHRRKQKAEEKAAAQIITEPGEHLASPDSKD